jgi:hypothetical protein
MVAKLQHCPFYAAQDVAFVFKKHLESVGIHMFALDHRSIVLTRFRVLS